jgi:hypothetical protein
LFESIFLAASKYEPVQKPLSSRYNFLHLKDLTKYSAFSRLALLLNPLKIMFLEALNNLWSHIEALNHKIFTGALPSFDKEIRI